MASLNFLRMVQYLNHILEYRFLCQNSPKTVIFLLSKLKIFMTWAGHEMQQHLASLPEIGTCNKANFQMKPTL